MPDIADTNLPAKDVIRHLTHELRQPLSALESIAFYLQMTVGGGGSDVSAQVERLQQMVDNANWVLSDVLHLLQMAPATPVAVVLEELLEEVLCETWASEGLAVETDIDEALPAMGVDLEQARHLFRSVLHFMRRSVEEPRTVLVVARAVESTLHIAFSAHAPHVVPTALFHPLEGNQLLTCRRIAENNYGHFSAETTDQGRLILRLDLPVFA
jgi:nitrogen-specific signal transduction histidine kinase